MRHVWITLIWLFPIASMATLGEPDTAPSPAAGAATASASSPAAAAPNAVKRSHISRSTSAYKVREQSTVGTGVIHEYVNNDGIVFAVSWKGPSHPDITMLLGRYTNEAARAHREHRRKIVARQSVSRVETPNIVYQRAGHMGDISGLAYVPALMPSGVVEGELHD